MEYQTTAVAIETPEALQGALSAGAEIQYTVYPHDPVEVPRDGLYALGWIVVAGDNAYFPKAPSRGKLRAFYPVQAPHDRYMAATAVLRDEE